MSNRKLDPKCFENREAHKKAHNQQQHEKNLQRQRQALLRLKLTAMPVARKATWHVTVTRNPTSMPTGM